MITTHMNRAVAWKQVGLPDVLLELYDELFEHGDTLKNDPVGNTQADFINSVTITVYPEDVVQLLAYKGPYTKPFNKKFLGIDEATRKAPIITTPCVPSDLPLTQPDSDTSEPVSLSYTYEYNGFLHTTLMFVEASFAEVCQAIRAYGAFMVESAKHHKLKQGCLHLTIGLLLRD